MIKAIVAIAVVCEIYGLICTISELRRSTEREVPKKVKRKLWWSLFWIVIGVVAILE